MPPSTLLASDTAASLQLKDAIQVFESGIVSRTVLQTSEIRAVLFTFSNAQELTSHTSRRRALVYIVDGECDFFFAGKWQRLIAGALVHLPPHHPHAVRAAHGPFSMLLTLGVESAETSSL